MQFEIRTERLTRLDRPSLELLLAGPDRAGGAPILLVHGAFTGAWCWQERCLGALASEERLVAAVSLRGHGGSEGRRNLRLATIEDFLDDLTAAIRAMPAPPILVGHSLGGYLSQLMLGAAPIRGLVLMSSLPPDGLALVGTRLALTDPTFWSEGFFGSVLRSKSAVELVALDILFGNAVPMRDRMRYARMMVPESPVALSQAHLPRWVLPANAAGVPALVMQGRQDRMIWEGTALRTALYHGAETAHVAEGSHLLMLDAGATEAARLLVDWLHRRRL